MTLRVGEVRVEDKLVGVVLVDNRRPLPMRMFRDAQDAEDFLEWLADGIDRYRRDLDGIRRQWTTVRVWDRCANYDLARGGCTGRAEPGHAYCEECECDAVAIGGTR